MSGSQPCSRSITIAQPSPVGARTPISRWPKYSSRPSTPVWNVGHDRKLASSSSASTASTDSAVASPSVVTSALAPHASSRALTSDGARADSARSAAIARAWPASARRASTGYAASGWCRVQVSTSSSAAAASASRSSGTGARSNTHATMVPPSATTPSTSSNSSSAPASSSAWTHGRTHHGWLVSTPCPTRVRSHASAPAPYRSTNATLVLPRGGICQVRCAAAVASSAPSARLHSAAHTSSRLSRVTAVAAATMARACASGISPRSSRRSGWSSPIAAERDIPPTEYRGRKCDSYG